MSKKALLIILVVSVAINLATLATFGYFWLTRHTHKKSFGHKPPHMFPEWHRSHLVEELELTEQQITEIRAINEELRDTVLPMRDELFKKRYELMSLVREKEPDKAKAQTLITDISALQAELDALIFQRLLKIKRILTPEQQDKLGALLNELIETDRPPEFNPRPPFHHDQGAPFPPNAPPPTGKGCLFNELNKEISCLKKNQNPLCYLLWLY